MNSLKKDTLKVVLGFAAMGLGFFMVAYNAKWEVASGVMMLILAYDIFHKRS